MLGIAFQFIISLVTVFLKGMQTQGVAHNKQGMSMIVSLLMTITSVLNTILIVQVGWTSIFPVGIGSMLGILLSLKFFHKINKTKEQ